MRTMDEPASDRSKLESFQRLETAMRGLFAVPKEELDERLREEKRKSRTRTDLTEKPAK